MPPTPLNPPIPTRAPVAQSSRGKPSKRPVLASRADQLPGPRKHAKKPRAADRRLADDAEHLAIDAVTGNLPAAAIDGVKTIVDLLGFKQKRPDGRRFDERKGSVRAVAAFPYSATPNTSRKMAVELNPGPPKRPRNVLALPPGAAKRAARQLLNRRRNKPRYPGRGVIAAQLGATRAPQSLNRRRRLRFVSATDKSLTLEGHDFMATVSVGTSLNPGDRILVADVHPLAIVGSSRLGRIASAFETYLYERYHATVITTADTSTKGNYTLHFDKDSGDALIPSVNGGYAAKEQAVAHDGIIKKAFENAELAMPTHNQQKEYYVQSNGSDARLTKQARFYVLCSTKPSAAYDMDIWINWRCVLRLPAIDGPGENSVGPLQLLTNGSSMSAANPFGTTAPINAPVRLKPGMGVGYNGTDTYVYCRVGFSAMAEFSFQTVLNGTTVTTFTHGVSSSLSAVPGSLAYNAGNTSGTLIDVHSYRYNGTPSSVALSNAYTWDGTQWVTESAPSALSVHWYVYMHLATFSSPSSAYMQFIEQNNYGTSRPGVTVTTPAPSTPVAERKEERKEEYLDDSPVLAKRPSPFSSRSLK